MKVIYYENKPQIISNEYLDYLSYENDDIFKLHKEFKFDFDDGKEIRFVIEMPLEKWDNLSDCWFDKCWGFEECDFGYICMYSEAVEFYSNEKDLKVILPRKNCNFFLNISECNINNIKSSLEKTLLCCTVCNTSVRNCLFLPCRHFQCCYSCGKKFNNCNLCNGKILATVDVFL